MTCSLSLDLYLSLWLSSNNSVQSSFFVCYNLVLWILWSLKKIHSLFVLWRGDWLLGVFIHSIRSWDLTNNNNNNMPTISFSWILNQEKKQLWIHRIIMEKFEFSAAAAQSSHRMQLWMTFELNNEQIINISYICNKFRKVHKLMIHTLLTKQVTNAQTIRITRDVINWNKF